MIELPEAVVIARQVTDVLRGRRIAAAVANYSPHKFAWFSGDPAGYDGLLAGKSIGGATGRGACVEIEAEDMLLVISAPLRYHAPGEKLPAKHQLLLRLADGSAVSSTIQMWGGLFCFRRGEQGAFADYSLALERPSPLSDGFDRAYFAGLFDAEAAQLSAKAFLATGQRIPGLGNGVLQDILWTARVHPKRKVAGLSAAEADSLFEAVRSVPRTMVEQGGRDTERDLFGQPGGYRTVLSRNTAGTPCPACGSLIRKEAYLGGSIYYCPRCQAV